MPHTPIFRAQWMIRQWIKKLSYADGIACLALRFILVPVFWMAGMQKFNHFESTVEWFGNNDWGLGFPMPWLLALLATVTELIGAVLLTLGLFTRLITLPLIIVMLVAIASVHWENGWQTIADPQAPFATESVIASAEKLERAREILRENGNYTWLTASGKFVILNNGIEFAAIYLSMLLALLFLGGGRYVSLDYWLLRWLRVQSSDSRRIYEKKPAIHASE